jgi:TolB-like protein/DNA-binding winged helix-turn-helix (wHTH) protein
MAATRQTRQYEFGSFRLDVTERLLLCNGERVPLPSKIFDTLLALVENTGRLVTKDELMSRLWPDSFVEEVTLARNISDLRKALSEFSGGQHYIETVPRHGYRFKAPVNRLADDSSALIVERYTRSRIVTEEHQNERLQPETGVEPIDTPLTTSGRKLSRTMMVVCGLMLISIVAVAAYFWVAGRSRRVTSNLEVKSLAVLPFKTLGEGERDEYLASGLADALITRLSNFRRITVRPTSAVLKYSAPDQDVVAAGRDLGVEAVLDGRIQKAGERIRVTVQLVRVSDGAPIWAAKFEENFTNIFRMQDSLSERVARELSPELTGEERALLTRRHTENPEAYEAYTKGRYWWNKRSGPAFRKATDYFNQAIALDGNYALAYAGLADCYTLLSPNSVVPPKDSYPKAKEAAKKALELDDQLSEAHTSLAHARWFYDWDRAGAEHEFNRAIELNPNYPTAHQWYSVYLTGMQRHDEAIAHARRAQELDPVSVPISEDVAAAYYYARQYDQAIVAGLKTLELNPNYYRLNDWLTLAYEQKGLYDQAIERRLMAMTLIKVEPAEIEAGRNAYRQTGWRGYWGKEVKASEERAKRTYVLPYNLARIYARLGDKEHAFMWLEEAFKEHSDHLLFIKVEPIFDGLRAEPRFADMLRRVGLDR